MYRISVTTLEKFRRCMLQLTDYDNEAALIDAIKGQFLGNEKTMIGEAYHGLIEGDFESMQHHFKAGHCLFTPAQARPAFDYAKERKGMIYEVPVRKVYSIPGRDVVVSGRLDGIEGSIERDIKTKFGAIDSIDYMDSLQWQFYLDMTSRKVFKYDVFEVVGFDALQGNAPYELPGVQFLPAETTTCLAYPDMAEKCHTALVDFFDFVAERELFPFLKTEPSIQKQIA